MDESTAKDISMTDISSASNQGHQEDPPLFKEGIITPSSNDTGAYAPARRKSTLLLMEDSESDQMRVDHNKDKDTEGNVKEEPLSHNENPGGPSNEIPEDDLNEELANTTVPVEIKWTQGGNKVYVTGSFTGWRKMIGLTKNPEGTFKIVLGLPMGTHRFRFVVDNELRFSDFLPTATDQMGNFVNYVEVTPSNVRLQLDQKKQERQLEDMSLDDDKEMEKKNLRPQSRKGSVSSYGRSDSSWGLTNDDDDMGNGYYRYHEDEDLPAEKRLTYISDIPPIFTDPKVMEQYYIAIDKQSKNQGQHQAWLYPPQLPPHLENVILNNYNSMDRDNNSGALPMPNHVVLNHLATTSIKHNTLAVASIVRYNRKYVTQVLYAPLQ